ncbi:MAG TPA: DUF3883 domain-containing protein [Acidimicrobiia bacterium]|nr:DUF3883 domain-containing protein [Acidimicrobiia bacterium]
MEDVSAKESFDLRCTKGGDELCVEVKGSTGDGSEVALTRNEVKHARESPTALFIMSGITLRYDDDGQPFGEGGVPRVIDPWVIDRHGKLEALAYSYRLNTGG